MCRLVTNSRAAVEKIQICIKEIGDIAKIKDDSTTRWTNFRIASKITDHPRNLLTTLLKTFGAGKIKRIGFGFRAEFEIRELNEIFSSMRNLKVLRVYVTRKVGELEIGVSTRLENLRVLEIKPSCVVGEFLKWAPNLRWLAIWTEEFRRISMATRYRRHTPVLPALEDYLTARFQNSRNTGKFSIEFKQTNENGVDKRRKFCGVLTSIEEILHLCRICGPVGVGIFGVKAGSFWPASSNLCKDDALFGAIESMTVGDWDRDQYFPPQYREGAKPVRYFVKLGAHMAEAGWDVWKIKLPRDILTEIVVRVDRARNEKGDWATQQQFNGMEIFFREVFHERENLRRFELVEENYVEELDEVLNLVGNFDLFPNLEEVCVTMKWTGGREMFLERLKKLEMKGVRVSGRF
ncbi:uncharacterized protein LOC118433641 [Folsomia candida]|nr:uncharacterized protein LOC118433641 [Folsomia candida]